MAGSEVGVWPGIGEGEKQADPQRVHLHTALYGRWTVDAGQGSHWDLLRNLARSSSATALAEAMSCARKEGSKKVTRAAAVYHSRS